MTLIVTGAAGFIGFHVSRALLRRGDAVIGLDNLNDYYDVSLKQARLDLLGAEDGFQFHRLDISDPKALAEVAAANPGITGIVHLAAQAGVRYSLINPYAYVQSNVMGHLALLELARGFSGLRHFVYASTSSIYGANTKLPFSVDDRVDTPLSVYAATKKGCEMLSHSYAHLYRLPQTGLRFFTVYGPWGRPDMAAFIFTKAILAGEPIRVFNNGDMRRDFTYVDDVVAGILAALDHPPADSGTAEAGGLPLRTYNVGNHRCEPLPRFIEILREAIGLQAEIIYEPMQPGDVRETYADIEATQRDLGFQPSTPIEVGLPRFVAWYREYYGV